MATVEVITTVVVGVLLLQVILGFGLLNVNVGAFVFGETIAVCEEEQPLAPVATTVNMAGLDVVTCAVAVPAPLNIDPAAGGNHV